MDHFFKKKVVTKSHNSRNMGRDIPIEVSPLNAKKITMNPLYVIKHILSLTH